MRRGLVGRPEGEVTWVTGEARACEARARVYLQRAACSTAALVGQLHEAAATSDARCLVQKLGPEQAQLPRPDVVAGRLGGPNGACKGCGRAVARVTITYTRRTQDTQDTQDYTRYTRRELRLSRPCEPAAPMDSFDPEKRADAPQSLPRQPSSGKLTQPSGITILDRAG